MPHDVLLRQLEDEDEDVRQKAAWIAGQLFVKDAVPLLLRILDGRDSAFLRHTAAVSLGRVRDLRASEELARVLKDDSDPFVRQGCAIGLGLLKDPTALPALRAASESPQNASFKESIAEAIKTITSVHHKHRSALEKKIEKSKREVSEHPDNGVAHNNLGVAYYHNRQYDLAIQHCDRAKALGAGVAWLEERLKGYRKNHGKGQ